MFRRTCWLWCAVISVVGVARADVFNMGGTRNADGTWTGYASLETVSIGNLGNTGEWSGDENWGGNDITRFCGAVDYAYRIGKYEVTAGQYTEFLNAVATTSDTYGLYDTNMWSDNYGCKILQSGSLGSYSYSVMTNWANRPVNFVSWGDAARFANWLHNGQPTGLQDVSTTEDGAYYLNGAITIEALLAVNRKANWMWALPTEDEWYKAAYHKNDGDTGNYYDYPTSNDSAPRNDLLAPDPGNNANFFDILESDYTIGSPYWFTEVGEFENSESAYGTFDQGGNVFEWYEGGFEISSNRLFGYRGGTYAEDYGRLAASYRYCSTTGGRTAGFRVACVTGPADFDRDAYVDGEDLIIWQTNFGLADPWGRPAQEYGDADRDGDVDGNDFLIWQREYDSSSFSSASVPEPSILTLFSLITIIALAFAHCRMRRCTHS